MQMLFKLMLSYKGDSRLARSLLGKCIYFWKVLVETNSTVYITPAPIEVKGQNKVPEVTAFPLNTILRGMFWVD